MFNSLINQAKLKKETNPEQWQKAVNVQANKQDNVAGVKEGTAKHVVGQTTSAKTAAPQTTTYTVNAGNQPYVEQLNALYDQIMNRKPFQYDLNSDLLYKQMADSYTQAGQKAMRDTMGTAAGLTGGYGNSYAQQVGNQAYQEHLTALNDQIPSLYEQALNAYLAEGDQMLQQYQLAAAHPGYVNAINVADSACLGCVIGVDADGVRNVQGILLVLRTVLVHAVDLLIKHQVIGTLLDSIREQRVLLSAQRNHLVFCPNSL